MRMPDIPASGPGLQAQGPAGQQAWGWTSCRHIAMERSARQLIHPHIDSLSQPAEAQGTAGRVEQRRVREWAKAQGQRGQKSRGGVPAQQVARSKDAPQRQGCDGLVTSRMPM
jgi:hypothetical protein